MRFAVGMFVAILSVGLPAVGTAQTPPTGASPQQGGVVQPDVAGTAAQPAQAPPVVRPNYVLGPNDQILIRVPEAEELNERPFRVDSEGNVLLPLVGTIKAGGLTIEQFEAELTKQLRIYVRNPQVTVTVAQYRSDPVFLTGAFNRPGIYSLQGQHTLLEMLTTVGGVAPGSNRRIRVTRRLEQGSIPLPNAIDDPDSKVSTVEISFNRLMESTSAPENIVLLPYDVLYAPRAEMVFINMEGGKAGAFAVEDRESLSVLQLLSLAGGLTPGAKPEDAKILRPVLNTSRRAEIPIDLKAILAGRANDYPLMPNDVLIVPQRSSMKSNLTRPLQFAVPALVTTLIWAVVRP